MMLERIGKRRRLIMLALVLVLAAVLGWASVVQASAAGPCVKSWNRHLRRYVWVCPCPAGWGSIRSCQVVREVRYGR